PALYRGRSALRDEQEGAVRASGGAHRGEGSRVQSALRITGRARDRLAGDGSGARGWRVADARAPWCGRDAVRGAGGDASVVDVVAQSDDGGSGGRPRGGE